MSLNIALSTQFSIKILFLQHRDSFSYCIMKEKDTFTSIISGAMEINFTRNCSKHGIPKSV